MQSIPVKISVSLVFLTIVTTEDALEHFDIFTEAETKALDKLKPLVSGYLYQDYMKDDNYLIRFLREKDLKIDATKNMLLKMVTWRKQNKIDLLVNQTLEIEKLIDYTITHDRLGQPVVTIKLADWHFRRIILAGRAKEIEFGIYKLMEIVVDEMHKTSEASGKPINKGTVLVEMSGYNPREHGCILCLRLYTELFQVYENYYPRVLDKFILINVPRGYEVTWNTIKPILSEHTRNSVLIYGFDKSEWRPALLKLIADDQLPTFFGGTFHGTRLKPEVHFQI